MTFFSAFRLAYREGTAFVLACPLLALVPFVAEMAQHVVEVKLGMYQSIAAAKALDADPVRAAFGFIKVLALLLPGYWTMRFIALGRDRAAAGRLDPAALRTFWPYLLVSAALSAIGVFAVPRTGGWVIAEMLLGVVVGVLFAAWAVAAPTGDANMGPVSSARTMARHLPWGVAFSLVVTLPLMVPHYLFAVLAIMGPKPLLWPILLVDAMLVSWLAAVLVASSYAMARRGGYPEPAA